MLSCGRGGVEGALQDGNTGRDHLLCPGATAEVLSHLFMLCTVFGKQVHIKICRKILQLRSDNSQEENSKGRKLKKNQ